jgi:hypothetical protein
MASTTEYASPLKPEDDKLPKAITLGELYRFLGNMLMSGANPANEVLVYKDPEGNGLVSVEGWAGFGEVSTSGRWRYSVSIIDSVQTSDDTIPPNGHLILSALHDLDWADM